MMISENLLDNAAWNTWHSHLRAAAAKHVSALGTLKTTLSGIIINEPTDAPKMRFFGAYVCEQTDMCECACNSNSHFAEIRATEHIPECERPYQIGAVHNFPGTSVYMYSEFTRRDLKQFVRDQLVLEFTTKNRFFVWKP